MHKYYTIYTQNLKKYKYNSVALSYIVHERMIFYSNLYARSAQKLGILGAQSLKSS